MSAVAPRVDSARLWALLMHSAKIGALPNGGMCRLALSDDDRAVRTWLIDCCEALGARIEIDRMGSIFAFFDGQDASLAPIAMGSHLDTQPTGGRFDGILGVLGGLEVVQALRDAGIVTRHPLVLINWTNEEGARFAPAMVASGVFAGAMTLEYGRARADGEGKTIGSELARIGFDGSAPVGEQELAAYFELHIEQGPVLESEDLEIGVVTGVQGMRWFDVTVSGQSCHAGTTPMAMRRDPVLAASRMVQAVAQIGNIDPGCSVSTIGRFEAFPGARNTVPASVCFSVDLRHPKPAMLEAMEQRLRADLPAFAEAAGCTVKLDRIWDASPVEFAPACVQAVRQAAEGLGLRHKDMISGAGHDAVYVARVAPTAMIFTPCRGGISHHESESITQAQAADGANVLLHAVLAYDLMKT